MTENSSTKAKLPAQERFQRAYLASRKLMQQIDLDLNRSQIIVVADNGRTLYRPFRWDH
ncbi:hypothetical protein [Vibrio aphrogenes]|uniref:hypothetical protein n=1 Tax=Vibrio aphrogenes TaxID=1891186 RepID=UPI0013DF34D6|nr:hypothetical protein [Vibrio aphrogenes]